MAGRTPGAMSRGGDGMRSAKPTWWPANRVVLPVSSAAPMHGVGAWRTLDSVSNKPRMLLGLLVAGAAVLGFGPPALAASGSTTVGTASEAWFRSTPSCALPTGCLSQEQATAPRYAPDTLHVGVNLGTEEARTHLRLDLAALPAGTKATGGMLRLPVATGPEDGTRSPETARIQACLLIDPVDEVDGSFDKPPAPDCAAASVPAVFVPPSGTAAAVFNVDLNPLASIWQSSPASGALALLPADGSSPTERWHVAFSQRDRTGEGVEPISAALSFVAQTVDTAEAAAPALPVPDSAGAGDVPGLPPVSVEALSAPPPEQPPPADPSLAAPLMTAAQPAPPAAVLPVAQLLSSEFRYPGVFLLPLLFVVAASWVGRALTRDLVAVDAGSAGKRRRTPPS